MRTDEASTRLSIKQGDVGVVFNWAGLTGLRTKASATPCIFLRAFTSLVRGRTTAPGQ